jgi:hypothetical protein
VKYHAIERPLTTALRSGSKKRSAAPAPVYRHGKCPVKHRSPEAAKNVAGTADGLVGHAVRLRINGSADSAIVENRPDRTRSP